MLKRILPLMVLALLNAGSLLAQEFDWVRKVEIKRADADFPFPGLWSLDPKIEADPAGNVFLSGNFKDTLVFETQSIYSKSGFDFFIAKYDAEGSVLWIKQINGSGDQMVSDVDIDRDGNLYLTGQFSGELRFPEMALTGNGAFTAKLDNNGLLEWAKTIEGNQALSPTRILATEYGEFFLAGSLNNTVDFGCSTLTPEQPGTKFIAFYNALGECHWAQTFVASYLTGLAFAGYNLYLTGGFLGEGVFGATTLTADFQDAYLARCDRNGEWHWALKMGGELEDQARDVEIDHSGNAIITGFFAGAADFGCSTLTSTGANDIFVASYDMYGGCKWARQAGGGTGNQYAFDVDVDAAERIIITGSILDETDFGGKTLTPGGEKSFCAAYDSEGTPLWALGTTGPSGDRGLDVTSFHSDTFVAGKFYGSGQYSFGSNAMQANEGEIYLCKVKNASQRFTRIVPDNAVGLQYSHNAWIDFDGDNDLDFLTTGAASTNDLRTILYENTGNHKFRPAQNPFNILPQYSECEIDFLNLNNDDRIDMILVGRRIGDANTNRISLIENNVNGFVDKGSLPDFGSAGGYSTVSVGDVNGDGFQDIFVSGITSYVDGNPLLEAFLYYNRDGVFTKSTSSTFIGLYVAASRFADLDNDGDLDLIVCGSDNVYPYQNTLIYLNDGNGDFSLSEIQLSRLQNPSIDVFDIDGDNDLDLLLTGLDGSLEETTKLYKNMTGNFAEVALPASINRTASGSAQWGDYDNDGDVDILITGGSVANTKSLAVFINENGEFTALPDPVFETLSIGYASWGDYDGDGDLDILATGATYFDNEHVSTMYILRNEMDKGNASPGVPLDFGLTQNDEQSCTLQWEAPVDDVTPSLSLTYNISVRNLNTEGYLLHPFSESNTGRRMVAEQGNVMLNRSWSLKGIEPGSYSIKVQAIDGGFMGSSWTEAKVLYTGTLATPSDLMATREGQEVQLSWEDNSVNEEFFVIERNFEDGSFSKLDSVLANVNTYVDATADLGSYSYRIYAVNPTQKTDYSNIVSSVITGVTSNNRKDTYLYPNPAADIVTLKVREATEYSGYLLIRNSNGMVVESANVTIDENGETHLNVSPLSPGLYFAELNTGGAKAFVKFMKK